MSTIKNGTLTASGEWRKHLRWIRRRFWKSERQAEKSAGLAEIGLTEAPNETVWRREGLNPSVWIEISRRSDGLFFFTEWKREHVIDPIFGDHDEDSVMTHSGLYGSVEAAKRDAFGAIDWLRELAQEEA